MKLKRSEATAFVFCITLLVSGINSQRPDYELFEWQENKFWWWSADAPMTKALDQIPDVVSGTKLIQDHFERIERSIAEKLGRRIPKGKYEFLRLCRSRDQVDWSRAVRSNFGVRSFPDPDLSCITDFDGVMLDPNEESPYSVDELYEAILRRALAIKGKAKWIASHAIDVGKNFTRADYMFNYPYNITTVACVLHPVQGIRMDGRWRIATEIHNTEKENAVPQLGRQILVEFHRVVDGNLTDNIRMRLPVRPKTGTTRVIREDATTILISTRGTSNPSLFRFIPIQENGAILESLDIARLSMQQAEDATTTSNIAILLLPLALNIIPIALLAEVSSIQMLLYTIMSDVLTVIPLLIKGIELLYIQAAQHRSVVLRLSSSLNSTLSESAAGEMWAVECQARENIRSVGVVFVSLSVIFLVGGTVLELVAKRYVEKRYRYRRHKHFYESEESTSSVHADDEEWSLRMSSNEDAAGLSKSSWSRSYSGDI